jgi:hypothetical protein
MSMVDIWRKKAADLREWARREPDTETCRQLLALADDYDELVANLERLPAPADQ